MLPSPPLTVPDVPISSIRFLTGELCSRGRRRMTPSVTRLSRNARGAAWTTLSPPSFSPDRLSVVVSWTGLWSSRSPPVLPGNGSHPVAPPSLARVPVSPVPRGQRYDEGATTSRLRIPGHLFVSLPGPTRSSVVRARFDSAPGRVEDPIRARAIVQPAAHVPALSRVDASGISQVPRRSIPCLCPGPRPRPDRRPLTITVSPMLPPLYPKRRLQRS